jgi:hypothetical protein
MQRNRLFLLLLAVMLCFAVFSCKKSSNDKTVVIGTSYFPLVKDKYVTYTVDSIYWIDTSCLQIDFTYQLQYVIKDTFTDAQKNIQYVFYSYINSSKTNNQWMPNDVFYATVTDTGIVVSKDQLMFRKFGFPVSAGTTWKGNSLIDTRDVDYSYFSNWTYSYQDVGSPYFNGNFDFQNTITVNEADQSLNDIVSQPDSVATRTLFKEIYAENVGLVYSEAIHWTYNPNTASCKKGYSVIMRAVDHN